MKKVVTITDRLVIRRISTTDAEFMLELCNEPAYLKYIGDKNIKTKKDAISYIENGPIKSYQEHGFGLFIVEIKNAHVPIGTCGLMKRDNFEDVDIGFAFLENFWSKGYSREAALSVIEYGKNSHDLKRLLGLTSSKNQASIRMLEKLGFQYEKDISMEGYDSDSKQFAMNI